MFLLVNESGEVLKRNTRQAYLDGIAEETGEGWVLSESEYEAIYQPDKFYEVNNDQ